MLNKKKNTWLLVIECTNLLLEDANYDLKNVNWMNVSSQCHLELCVIFPYIIYSKCPRLCAYQVFFQVLL